MFDNEKHAYIAKSVDKEVGIIPKMANRHGLITGATGTGKTVTLQNLAETFSAMGVPVFAADIKGDLSGVSNVGGNKESVTKRVTEYGLDEKGFSFKAFPVQFWDVFGEQGTPIRATIQDMGATLLARLMALNDTQAGVLSIIFKIAEDQNFELIDLKDLQKTVEFIGNNSKQFTTNYGNISTASIGAIQRGLLQLEQEGAAHFFGEPALNIDDLLQTQGESGIINILAADKLIHSPKVYSTFLLWVMTKLYETLPEVGDLEKPKLVFFFDEAHLLFNDSPKALVDKIEQVVRLIRSKGVGIYFVTQSPSDVPDSVLGQLGNRIQHALRAYTPKDQKALKAAAQTFRANPSFDTETAISELATGEALVSFLDEKGAPQPVERACILPPQGQIGPITADERAKLIKDSFLNRFYEKTEDRESAFEILTEKQQNTPTDKELKEQKKQEAQAQKEADREKRESDKTKKKFFGMLLSAIILPVLRNILNSFVKSKGTKSGKRR